METVGLLAGASTREIDIQAVTDFLAPLNERSVALEPVLA